MRVTTVPLPISQQKNLSVQVTDKQGHVPDCDTSSSQTVVGFSTVYACPSGCIGPKVRRFMVSNSPPHLSAVDRATKGFSVILADGYHVSYNVLCNF